MRAKQLLTTHAGTIRRRLQIVHQNLHHCNHHLDRNDNRLFISNSLLYSNSTSTSANVHIRTHANPHINSNNINTSARTQRRQLTNNRASTLFNRRSRHHEFITRQGPRVRPIANVCVRALARRRHIRHLLPNNMSVPNINRHIRHLFINRRLVRGLLRRPTRPSQSRTSLNSGHLRNVLQPERHDRTRVQPIQLQGATSVRRILQRSLHRQYHVHVNRVTAIVIFRGRQRAGTVQMIHRRRIHRDISTLQTRTNPNEILNTQLRRSRASLVTTIQRHRALQFRRNRHAIRYIKRRARPIRQRTRHRHTVYLSRIRGRQVFQYLNGRGVAQLGGDIRNIHRAITHTKYRNRHLQLVQPITSRGLFRRKRSNQPIM